MIARQRLSGDGGVRDHAAAQARSAPRAPRPVPDCRPPATSATWPSRSISCFIDRTKSPAVRSASVSTLSRRWPDAQRWATKANPGVGLAQEGQPVPVLEVGQLGPAPVHLLQGVLHGQRWAAAARSTRRPAGSRRPEPRRRRRARRASGRPTAPSAGTRRRAGRSRCRPGPAGRRPRVTVPPSR